MTLPAIFICPCPPDPSSGYCATEGQCLAQRQGDWNDYREVCRAMRAIRELQRSRA